MLYTIMTVRQVLQKLGVQYFLKRIFSVGFNENLLHMEEGNIVVNAFVQVAFPYVFVCMSEFFNASVQSLGIFSENLIFIIPC